MNNRVIAAFAFGSALLLAAYTFSDFGGPAQPTADPRVEAVVAKAPTRQYIPSTDSNNDGVPDWQEVLVKTTPLTLTDVSTTPYQAPDTLTETFAVNFFEVYMRNKGYGDFGQKKEDVIAAANNSLVSQTQDKLFAIADITFAVNDDAAVWRSYGNAIASLIIGGPKSTGVRNEITILEEAVAKNNKEVLAQLDPIIAAYTYLLDGYLRTPVPSSLVPAHLNLINSLNAVLTDIKAMKEAFDDPLYTLLRIQRYQDDVKGLYTALLNMQNKLKSLGVTYEPFEPAAQVMIKP